MTKIAVMWEHYCLDAKKIKQAALLSNLQTQPIKPTRRSKREASPFLRPIVIPMKRGVGGGWEEQ